MLNSDDCFHVMGDTGDGAEAIELVKSLKPGIVLLDLNMSAVDGFEMTRQICVHEHSSKVIGLSVYNNIFFVRQLLTLGAMGYLTKNISKEEMRTAIIEVSNGNQYICEGMKHILSQQALADNKHLSLINSLSKREIEIVQHIKKGLSSKEIALLLDVGFKTIEVHRSNILGKLNLKNTASLINFFNINRI